MLHPTSRLVLCTLVALLSGLPARILGHPVAALQAGPETPAAAATGRLLEALASGSESERESAAFELAETAPAAVPVLTEALSDPDWGVRAAAATSLGRYGTAAASAVAALKKAKKDDEATVREAAGEALRAIGGGGSGSG